MINIILYLLVGVLTYIACVVYWNDYDTNTGFIVTLLLWPILWVLVVLFILKRGVDWVAFKIKY